jgi:hypothetical protein
MGGDDLAGAVRADQGHVPAGVGADLAGGAEHLVWSDGIELIEPIEHRNLDSHHEPLNHQLWTRIRTSFQTVMANVPTAEEPTSSTWLLLPSHHRVGGECQHLALAVRTNRSTMRRANTSGAAGGVHRVAAH